MAEAQRGPLEWSGENTFTLGGATFVADTASPRFESTPDRFCLVKTPGLVGRYLQLIHDEQPRRIVELGVCKGGSTAMLAALARPEMLVAVELNPTRIDALDRFVASQGLDGNVRIFYGTSQADPWKVPMILDECFGDRPLDMVLDDASHDLDLTRESFNLLFPRIRPGGVYVIEDWAWAHVGFGIHRPDDTPLTALVFEVVMALASRPGLVESVEVTRHWAVIRRGDAPTGPGFDVSGAYNERGRRLLSLS